MKSLNQYLDDAKEITGSDTKTAEAIGVKKQYVSDARQGRGFSNRACRRLASLLGVNPLGIIAAADAEKHPEEAAEWARWVAVVLLSVTVTSTVFSYSDARGNTVNSSVSTAYNSIHYAQIIRRRLLRWLASMFPRPSIIPAFA